MAASPSGDLPTVKSPSWSSLGLLATIAVLPTTNFRGQNVDLKKVKGPRLPRPPRKSCSRVQFREQRRCERKTAKAKGEPPPVYSGHTDSDNTDSELDPDAPPDSVDRDKE
jgi:hypothetical protein